MTRTRPAVVLAVAGLVLVDGWGPPAAQAVAAVGPAAVAGAVAASRLRHRPAAQRAAWLVQLVGVLVLAVGYGVFQLALLLGGTPGYAVPADPFFLAGSALVTTWLLLLNRGTRDRAATVDAGIAVTGLGVAITALLLRPALAGDPDPVDVAFTAVYPVLDLLGLGLLLRLRLAGRAPTRPANLLAASWGCLLFGDSAFGALVAVLPVDVRPWLGLPFQLALLLQAVALVHPRSDDLGTGVPRTRAWSRTHWVVVGGAACLPPAVLLAQGVAGVTVDWLVTGTGSLLLSALAVSRVHHAVLSVQGQADLQGRLARTDELTGLPNRRSWDADLRRAAEAGGPVAVALLDLDHFKRLNDSRGHAAGDLLLRAAADAWRSALPGDAVLARHGGEEFALLLQGDLVAVADVLADRLRKVCPAPQTVSVGLAVREPGEHPAALLARVDDALYRAKAEGRDRVCTAAPTG
ncbi:diguanylate cyclase domain-containing protein [Kineococcus sp. DHX-1]|uniref:GGDEF domain-containing protein n=1 Tax=Kineococcus sp. DHX-1 TaxID=3349638 RepID=UPI0036D3BE1A